MPQQPGEPLRGDVIDGGRVRAYGWEWSEIGGSRGRSRVPWFGVFLVVFGALLLLQRAFPAAVETAGSLLFLAVGVAFLVSWVINRGMGSLYLGAIITALAAPDLLRAANVVSGAGVGTLCLGIAFLLIALVRTASGAGWGWQAGLGVILVAIGASTIAVPNFSDLVWPLLLVVLGVLLLLRSSSGRRSS
ncbi:MAG: hypothetical protein ACYDAN_12330 [Candidatus Limnocylindrales bacterium]